MAAFIISNLAGLIRQILVARAFGTQADIDAFNAANRVSETLFNLVAGGALASAFIPNFTQLLVSEPSKHSAWKLASSILNLILLSMSIICAAAAWFAPQIVRYILAPGFSQNPLQEALTIDLLRLMLPSAAIFGVSGLVMAILNSHQVFLAPALTPALYQLGLIFGVVILSPSMGIYGLAWGVLIGAAAHLGSQIPSLLRQGLRYLPTFGLSDPAVHNVFRLLAPRLLGVAVVQLNFWINARLASQMIEGSYTSIVTAFTLMYMPQAAIAQSIAIAAMPTFSTQAALGRMEEMRASLSASLRSLLLLSIPASVGLILLRTPMITLLYQRGQFDARSTSLVAWALLWYAAGLVGHCVVEVVARAFYAVQDTRTPVLVGALAMALNVIFSYLFASLFEQAGWMPHGGLALANSLATALEMLGLLYLMRRRLKGLQASDLLKSVYQSGIASLGMAAAILAWTAFTSEAPAWLEAGAGVLLGALVYLLIVWLIGVQEVRSMAAFIRGKLARSA
jgi:putative peptidoglycan lipid II flippase